MVASLVRFLFTCYEESHPHSFAALTRLPSLGVVEGKIQPFSGGGGGGGGGGERGEEKRFLTNSIYQLF